MGRAVSGSLEYEVRVSNRARHARLSVSYAGRVTIVIPERFSRAKVPEIVDAKRDWIEQAQRRFASEGALVVDRQAGERPERLHFRMTGEELPITYRASTGPARAVERSGLLVIISEPNDEDSQRLAMKRYLARRARKELSPRLALMAGRVGVRVKSISIRAQQTRWGSCSPSGAISLNSSLLFLPEPLVHYVLLHELCHRRELNHSPRFWTLLTQFEPNSEGLRRDLRAGWHFVPGWLND